MESNFRSDFEQAKRLFDQRNYEACNKIMLGLLNSNYETADCQYYLGLTYLNLKRYDEATEQFSNCLKVNPHNFDCLYYLGVTAEIQASVGRALFYYRKTIDEKPDHINALNAIERLNGDHVGNEPVIKEERGMRKSTKLPNDKVTLYDELVESKDRNSQIAVQMIDKTRMIDRKPLLSAYLGKILLRFIIILVSLYLVLNLTDGSDGLIFLISFAVLIITVLSLSYLMIRIKTVRVTIDEGLIEVTTGISIRSREKRIFLTHKTDHFSTRQNLFNQLTGDCTLVFEVDTGDKRRVELTGLGKKREIDDLAKDLQILRYQLRNTPLIKSGIFG